MMRVGIIGAGLQCKRRAPVVIKFPNTELAVITSLSVSESQKTASQFNCDVSDDWKKIVKSDDIDIVLVCTPPYTHAEMSISAMKNGKHVLCEKPMTRNIEEAENMVKICEEHKRVLKCGFNHRHHPAILEAKRIVDEGTIGKIIIGRCVYGICGRPGYENEWRANPEMASGGQFIEQGTHAIDLFRWFIGEIEEVNCMTGIQFFNNQVLDDNGMAILRAKNGALISIHSSLTQWKNTFSFELIGEDGYIKVEGLGSSYGTEKLIVGKKDYYSPFNYSVTEYRGGDSSWELEWQEFYEAIVNDRLPIGNVYDGFASMRIALACYDSERNRSTVKLI